MIIEKIQFWKKKQFQLNQIQIIQKKKNIEKAISIETLSNNLSKEKDSINYAIFKDKQNQKQINNDVKFLKKNLLNKNQIVEYNNSSLSTTFQINEEDVRKCNTLNQSNFIIELDSDSENESNIKGIENATCRSEEFSNIQKNKIYENINNRLSKKRKRIENEDEDEMYINIDNKGVDFNKYEYINLEKFIEKNNKCKINNNNNEQKKKRKKRKKKY